jgi:hypothetical protein
MSFLLLEPSHWIMQKRQFTNLERRARRDAARPGEPTETLGVERAQPTDSGVAAPGISTTTRKVLLLCGILSSLLYIATDMLAGWLYEGYSSIDQNYSELLATGAPTRPFMLLVGIAYNLLVAAFAVGVWTSAGPKRTARITGIMMLGYALLSMITPLFFQMDMRGAEITPRGSLHGPMTAVMSLFILLSMGFGAFLVGRWFRFYSFMTIVIVLTFGVLTALQAPQLEAGQSTPWMGFTERINIYATMLWFAVLAIALLRGEDNRDRTMTSAADVVPDART